ncbi:MAG: TetR family transcriptional regulator [Bacteroidota bacterium]
MKKSDQTRLLIIEKAAALFNKQGFAGTSMQDIMDATGLTKGGIYGNFKRDAKDKKGVKDEIAVAAFAHSVERVGLEIRQRTKVIDNSIDKLKAVVYFYKERILNPPIEGGCPILNTSIEADDNHPMLRQEVLQAIEFWHHGIASTIRKGIERSEIKEGTDPEDFATVFIGTLEGGILLARIYKNLDRFNVMATQLLAMLEDIRFRK